MTPRVCEHGQLARVCLTCELQADLKATQARSDEYCREWESACERERARLHEVKELQARIHLLQQHLDAALESLFTETAERDRLAGVVEAVKALADDWVQRATPSSTYAEGVLDGYTRAARDIDRALAEPVEATFPRGRECGKWKQP